MLTADSISGMSGVALLPRSAAAFTSCAADSVFGRMTPAMSEAGLENALEEVRIHGAYGYSKEYSIERLCRAAPLMCIGEGTNEMQRIIIARQLIEQNPV